MKFLLSGLVLFYFLSLFSLTKQEILNRTCASFNVQPQPLFRHKRYDGTWYAFIINDYTESMGQDCIVWDYLTIESAHSKVIETSVNLATNTPKTIYSEMFFDRRGYGQYTYDVPADNEVPEYVKVIKTDYNNYSVEWSCVDIGPNQSDSYVYVIYKSRNPRPEHVKICEDTLKKHNIVVEKARRIIQDEATCRKASRKA